MNDDLRRPPRASRSALCTSCSCPAQGSRRLDTVGDSGAEILVSTTGAALDSEDRLYQEADERLHGDVITVSEMPETQDSADTGARWSASAAAFVAWRDGQADALEELVRLLSPVLWQVVRATGLDRESAEDVVQSTWLALVRSAESISSPQAVAGWLCTTARREAWRASKRGRQESPTDETALAVALPDVESPEFAVVLDDEKKLLVRCLKRLNERCQTLLRIVAAGPRPDYAEISSALGMPIGSIGPTRARCLEKLRAELVVEGGVR